jgi:citrate lyase beta subunit
MKRDITYLHLGGTLFVPATHKNLKPILQDKKYPNLKSLVICLEDSISDDEVDSAKKILQDILIEFDVSELLVFVRPRNIDMLKEIYSYQCINKLDGFILPKFSIDNIDEYISMIKDDFFYMPSLEGADIFDISNISKIRDEIVSIKSSILTIRVGSEDIMSHLGIKKGCESSYDILPLATILTSVLITFRPYGFNISATVYKCYKDIEKFKEEVTKDISNGFWSKTIIHPNQIEIINNLYKVSTDEYTIAQKLLSSDDAVLTNNQQMYEKKPHTNWANTIIDRANIYGIVK